MAKRATTARINALFHEGKWEKARQLIRADLADDPENHWLLARLATTFYEQRRYGEARKYAERAQAIVPECPLALWELAGALQMLGKTRAALARYTQIVGLGLAVLHSDGKSFDGCWEDPAWAMSLMTDAMYRKGLCCQRLGESRLAWKSFVGHLALRLQGATSIYPAEDVIASVREVNGARRNAPADKELRKAAKILEGV
jgi:tetratricopeptide (TPR) repeat protein